MAAAAVLQQHGSKLRISVELTFEPGTSMLEYEEEIQQALNEVGALASGKCLEQFDTDGSPILVGGIKLTSKGPAVSVASATKLSIPPVYAAASVVDYRFRDERRRIDHIRYSLTNAADCTVQIINPKPITARANFRLSRQMRPPLLVQGGGGKW